MNWSGENWRGEKTGVTPLHEAATLAIVRTLLEHGADPTLRSTDDFEASALPFGACGAWLCGLCGLFARGQPGGGGNR